MATTEEIAAEFIRLDARLRRLQAQRDEGEAKLLERIKPGDELVIGNKTIKVRDRSVLIPDLLEERVSPETWEAITVRKPDSLLMKLAKRMGRISDADVAACSKRSKAWLEVK